MSRHGSPYDYSARVYRNLGFTPIPIGRNDKMPTVAGFHGRSAKAMTDLDLQRLMNSHGRDNVAIVLPNNLIGIDVDAHSGKAGEQTYVALEDELGCLTPTYISTARNDGLSGIRLYRIPEDYADIEWPGKAGPGIDIIAWYIRYVNCWPSWHSVVGKPYRWYLQTEDGWMPVEYPDPALVPELPLKWCEHLGQLSTATEADWSVDVPEWLKEHGGGSPCPQMVATAARHARLIGEATDGGGLHDEMTSAVYAIVGDMSAGHTGGIEALAEIRLLYMGGMTTRARRRNSDAMASWNRSVNGAVAKKAGLAVDDEDPCSEIGERLVISPVRMADPKLLRKLRTGDWLNSQVFDELVFAVPSLVPEGLTLIAGPPKIGKSVLLLRFGLEVARGGMVFGQQCDQLDVFYLALEDGDRRMQDRCREMLDGETIPSSFSYQTTIEPGKLVATVGAWLQTHPDGFVLVDTLGRALERPKQGETTYDRDYRIMVSLKAESDRYPGSSVIVSHHSRKAESEDWLSSVSGTNAIAGGADTIIMLARVRNSGDGIFRITGRDVDEAEYLITLEKPYGWRLNGDDLEASAKSAQKVVAKSGLGERGQEVISYIEDRPDGVTREMLVEDMGFTPKDAIQYLNRLYNSGRISRIKRGVYGPNAIKINIIRLPDGRRRSSDV